MSSNYNEYLRKHLNGVKTCYKLLTNKSLESHDKSKLIKSIYNAYDDYFYGNKNENNFNYAWLIHQNKEPHHWQYWVLIKDSGEIIPLEMPLKYIYEMIADWASFSFKDKKPDSLTTWYNDNKDKMKLHDNTRKEVDKLIPIMVEKMKEYFNNKDNK